MALQPVANGMGIPMDYGFIYSYYNPTNFSLNAAGESIAQIGRVFLEAGSGSKTISSSGGKITFRAATVTFANAGTNLRVGIQDVASTGLEDGTFDVYADFTGGGGGIASNTWYEKAMTTGTKTISHGDLIAICFETTTRGGADDVGITGFIPQSVSNTNQNYPYKTLDTGAGPGRSGASCIVAAIVFDDGTLGWIEPNPVVPNMNTISTIAFNQTSTPDEYAAVFRVPFKCSIRSAYLNVGSIASTDKFEIILYSDAEGTPVAEQTVAVDPNYVGSVTNNASYWVTFTSETLLPGIKYAIALRPTTNNNIQIGYHNITTTFGSKYKKMLPFGSLLKMSSRTNQTGAFSEVQTYYLPIFGILIDKLDDGVSSGGGSSPFAFVS